jgi:UDP-3-O-[3-hydroxymyristoyl] glucosamine N-acyltransferase
MNAPHFFKRPSGLTVGEIAAITGAEPSNGARLNHLITDIAPIDRAGPSDLAFLDTAKYADALTLTLEALIQQRCSLTDREMKRLPLPVRG